MTVRQQVLALLERRPDITAAHLATAVPGISTAAAHQYIAGQLTPTENTDRHFARTLKLIESGDILRAGYSGPVHITEAAAASRRVRRKRDFFVIETTRRVQQVLNYCSDQCAIGICTADYGVGKSESVRYWRENDGRKIDHLYFEFDDFSCRGAIDFLSGLAEQLGIPTRASTHTGGRVMRAICEALEKRPQLLIFDQCEMVMPRVFQIIRQIWDRTRDEGVGVAFLASPMLLERLQKSRMRDLGALSSRVGIWAALSGVQKSEAAAILRQEGVQIDEGAFDLLYRATGGSMRRLMAVTDMLVAKHGGKPVTEKTIEGVATNLWGLQLQARPRAVA